MAGKVLIIDVAALGCELLRHHGWGDIGGLPIHAAEGVFPAVTCTAQGSFRTAQPPGRHGMVANGLFFRDLRKVLFWEQSYRLVAGQRIWSACRRRGGRKVALLFWQQSMGEDADMVLTPAPIHKHHGGMIQDCYARPDWLYGWLCGELGEPFRLRHYWGPLASCKSGEWIARATGRVLAEPRLAPDVCLTYLPTLDYDLQRSGPASPKAAGALAALKGQLAGLLAGARELGYEVVVFGDCAMGLVTRAAVLPNLALRRAGLLKTRAVRGMQYLDLHASRAFAVADHEVAHVYVADPADVPAARDVLAGLEGIGEVLGDEDKAACGLNHPNAGELVAVAAEGAWLAYPWWTDRKEAPDYATHVDIHNKPGYDPCELFFGWPPMSVSQDLSKVRGAHGRCGAARAVAWASTIAFDPHPATLLELAAAVRHWLDES